MAHEETDQTGKKLVEKSNKDTKIAARPALLLSFVLLYA